MSLDYEAVRREIYSVKAEIDDIHDYMEANQSKPDS